MCWTDAILAFAFLMAWACLVSLPLGIVLGNIIHWGVDE